MIRSLMYLTASRYDIQFSTCLCARYQANPKESHLIAVKRIFKYLKGTHSLGLWYPKCLCFDLKGYLNSDYAEYNMDRISTLGACQLLGGKRMCWSAKKKQSVAMSSAKAEYVASAGCCANILCMKSQLTNYDIIYEKDIELHFFLTQYQLADIFTKPPDEPTFKRLIVELGGKTGGHDQISNKDAIILYCLANGVEIDFAKVIWEDIIHKLNKKSRKKFVPYPRSISLLLEYMMPEYENDELTLNSTQVFSVHNWALKPNQPEGPPLIDHMLAICKADVLVKSKAPKTSSKAEKRVSQGKMSGAKIRIRRKQSSKHTSESKTEANKASTHVVAEMHKEDQQAAGGPTSLRATSEEEADPQLSSGCDASVDSIAEVDPRISDPNDSIPPQQGMDEGTQNYSLDHILAGTNPSVLVDKTKSPRDGLKTVHTNLGTNVESSSDEISKIIRLKDLSKMMQDVKTDFMDLDSPKDGSIFVQDENEEEEEADKYEDTHATSHEETEDSSVPHPPSLKIIQFRELTNQVLLLQSQNQKLEQLKNKAKAEFSFLTAQRSYLNVITVLSREVKELNKHVQGMEFELPGDWKEISTKLETFTSVVSIQAKLKTLDTLPSLLNKVTDTLTRCAHILENASPKAGEKSVPLAGQAGASPAEGEKNTNQAIISQLFQRKIAKDAKKANPKQQPKPKTPPTTSSFLSPFSPSPPRSSPQTEGILLRKTKAKQLCIPRMMKKKRLKVILKMIMPIQLIQWLHPPRERS
ncbi:hypothetical protein Tco_0985468 [Tanacetum coccineum]